MAIKATVGDGKAYIDEMVENFGVEPSAWLEGWICGYTDPVHGSQGLYDELHEYLMGLKSKV